MKTQELESVVETYLEVFPEERPSLSLLLDQLRDKEQLNSRKNFRGHIAGDGLVLSPDHRQLLVVHHRVFDIWLQPGGHWDPEDATPLVAANREVAEETGLKNYKLVGWRPGYPQVPLDIDTHPIPANAAKQEAAHFHHSFAFVFQATSTALNYRRTEVLGARWITMPQAAALDRWHFPRVIQKLEKLKLI